MKIPTLEREFNQSSKNYFRHLLPGEYHDFIQLRRARRSGCGY